MSAFRKGVLLSVVGLLVVAAAGYATPITYTSDPTVSDFTTGVNFATLSDFTGGDRSSPYTPTASSISSGLRVYSGTFTAAGLPANNWILATFSNPVSSIEVLPNIDHFGAAFDGYQYTIEGSNDLTTWTPLFDAVTVSGAGEPFTLGSFSGTAPTLVNNVLTPGAGPAGTVGYEAFFTFGSAYQYYAFGASSIATTDGNTDQELSGVGTSGASPVPEPATLTLTALGLTGVVRRYRRRRTSR